MQKLTNNINAIKLALELVTANREITQEEIRSINSYSGFGGIKAILFPLDKNWQELNVSKADLKLEKEIRTFYDFLKNNFPTTYHDIWDSLKSSVLTSFYTPKELPELIFQKLKENNKEINSFLEPSAGTGIYIDEFIKFYPDAKVTAIEIDQIASLLLKAKYQHNSNITLYEKGFQQVNFKNQKFDVIASNIPFGDIPVHYSKYPKEVTDKIHNFFFFHSHKLLKEGGLLSFVTSAGVFNSKKNEYTRKYIAENTEDFSLTVLPNNFFKSAGTEVTSHLFNGVKNTVTENIGLFNDLLAQVDTDDENITLNKYISFYSDFAFLKQPKIDTNPYGNFEYNYKIPEQEAISLLKNSLVIPELSIHYVSNDLVDELEILNFNNYPNDYTINSLTENDKKLVNFINNENIKSNKVIGAFNGNYLGKSVPLFVVSKSINDVLNQKYYIETFVKNHSFDSDIINKPILAKKFSSNIGNFLKEVSLFAQKHQIDVDVDFKNDIDGISFSKYMLERFEFPTLKTKYYTLTDEFINYMGVPGEQELITLIQEKKNSIYNIEESIFYERENKYVLKLQKNENLTLKKSEYITDLLTIYTDLRKLNFLYDYERKDLFKIKEQTEALNNSYDLFVSKYGLLNKQKYSEELIFYVPFLKALEKEVNKNISIDLFNTKSTQNTYEKADIFNYDFFNSKELKESNLSLEDAIINSLLQNKEIDLKLIEELTQLPWEELENGAKEYLIYNPLEQNYEIKEKFLQGNLYIKRDKLKKLQSNQLQNEKITNALNYIEENLPEKIPYHQINIQFSSRWLPTKYLNKFVDQYYLSNFNLSYNAGTDNIFVNPTFRGSKYNAEQMLNSRYIYPENIIQDAFYDRYPVKTHKGKVDVKSTNYYRKQINLIKKGFNDFMKESLNDQEKKEIENLYNHNYNSNAIINYGSKLVNLEEANLKALNISEVYPHQKEALWKSLIKGGGLFDHEVGFGKTLTMILSSYYMKKFGICKKPILTGIKPNIEEIANTYKLIFPNAKILYASEKDYTKKNRDVFFNKIKMNDWDAVIMSHDQLTAIPYDQTIGIDILQEKIDNIENNMLEVYSYDELGKKQLRALEAQKIKLDNKLTALQEEWKVVSSKNVYTFDKLGIDHIVTDESHIFKNLSFETRHSMVAGLGNINGSGRADKMLYHIRSIQKQNPNQLGASFYSGTPISNSLTELYALQTYLTPQILKEKNIRNFDSWASLFTKKSVEFETNIVGQVVQKERFRNFINMPELSRMYVDMAHVMTGENPYVKRPDKNEYTILTEQTPLQRRFNVKLIKFLETEDINILDLDKAINVKDQDSLKKAKSLIATNLAQKASMDMRLINGNYIDEKNSKINSVVKNLMENYIKFNEHNGTQILFCDQGVSKKKYSYTELKENYENQVFTSIYDDIKFKLIYAGVNEEEIAFIQDYKTDKKKALLTQKMNKGEIRILLGTTDGAGTGLNVQQKLSNIVHFTIPWKPSAIEQRDGRGYRKGNILAQNLNENKIDIGYAVTKQTLDNYRIDINKTKKGFIDQIRTATNSNRTADEGMMDENTGMNLAELQAVLSGDNTLLEKSKVDKQIKMLEADKEYIEKTNYHNKYKFEKIERRIESLDFILKFQQTDLDHYEKNVIIDKKGKKLNEPKYINFNSSYDSASVFLEERWRKAKKLNSDTSLKVGEMFGFSLYMRSSFFGTKAYIKRSGSNVEYTFKDGKLNFNQPKEVEKYYLNCFRSIKQRLSNNINEKEKQLTDLKLLKPQLNKVFDEKDKLFELEEESERLGEKLQEGSLNNKYEPNIIEKEIEGQMLSFNHIESLEQLEYNLLWDNFTKINQIDGVFLNLELKELLTNIADKSPCIEIYNDQYDITKDLYFLKLEIHNPDELFLAFSNEKELINDNKINMLKKC